MKTKGKETRKHIYSCHEEKRTETNIRVISIETQTVNEPVKTTNCETQTVTDKSQCQVISETQCSSEVDSQRVQSR